MKPSIIAVEDGVTITNPDAATLARLTLAIHETECRECGSERSDSRCPAGEKYAEAARPDHSWIPGPRQGT